MATKRLLVQQPGRGDRWQALQVFDDGRHELNDLDTPQAARWQKEGGFEIVPGERFTDELRQVDARAKAQATERGLGDAGWLGDAERGNVTGISMRPAAGDSFDVEATYSGGATQRAGMDRARAAALQGLMGANMLPPAFKGPTVAQKDAAVRDVMAFQDSLKKPFRGPSPADVADAEAKVAAFKTGLQRRAVPTDSGTAARPAVAVGRAGSGGALRPFQPFSAPRAAETMASQAEGVTNVASPAPVADTEFADAQQAAADRGLLLGLSRAAQNVNAGLTGAATDREAFNAMTGQVDNPVRRLLAQRKADEAKRLGDPSSPESKRFQAAVAKALPGVYSPEEIALMTAGDKDNVMQAGEMRQKLDMRKADLERAAGQRQEDIGLEQVRTQQQQQFQAGEAAKQRAFQREQQAREFAAQSARAAQGAQGDKLEQAVQGLGKDVEGTAGIKQDLDFLDSVAKEKDIPGVGRWDSRKTGVLSPFASNDDVRVLQTTRSIVGRLLKERSGTAASDAEVERVMQELGMGPGASEQEFREGLKRLRSETADTLSRKEAKFRPGVVEEYRRRGGQTSADFAAPAPTTAAPASPRPGMVQMADPSGAPGWVDPSEVAEAEANGYRRL